MGFKFDSLHGNNHIGDVPICGLDVQRWRRLCQTLEIEDPGDTEFSQLATAYGEPQRFYHTAQHIGECLALLDWLITTVAIPPHPFLEMALWYHDVVYQPLSFNNEYCSAHQAMAFLQASGMTCQQQETVATLIMATHHLGGNSGNTPGSPQAQILEWMVDIDLAILGASPQRFAQYEAQIRQEYSWVPEPVYRQKRQAIFMAFLERPTVYKSSLFQQRFETQARYNLLAMKSTMDN